MTDKTDPTIEGEYAMLSQGEYSDYGVYGILKAGPNATAMHDLMAAFRAKRVMIAGAGDGNGYFGYVEGWDIENFYKFCIEAGGWVEISATEFHFEEGTMTLS